MVRAYLGKNIAYCANASATAELLVNGFLAIHARFSESAVKSFCVLKRPSCMGGATDFKVGVQNRIRERSERKKKFVPPTFPNVGGTSKQISVGTY